MSHLILVSGPPGCGKSTLSNGLARNLRAVVLDKDCIDEPFSPNDRGEQYTREIEPKCLTALLSLARRNLENGMIVIADVPWTHILVQSSRWQERILTLVEATGCELLVLEAAISEEELRGRLKSRGFQRDQVKLSEEGWEKFKKNDCLGEVNPLAHQTIDFSLSPEKCLEQALVFVTKSHAPENKTRG